MGSFWFCPWPFLNSLYTCQGASVHSLGFCSTWIYLRLAPEWQYPILIANRSSLPGAAAHLPQKCKYPKQNSSFFSQTCSYIPWFQSVFHCLFNLLGKMWDTISGPSTSSTLKLQIMPTFWANSEIWDLRLPLYPHALITICLDSESVVWWWSG